MGRFLAVSTVLALALSPLGEARAADFAYGFAACPERITGMPGEEKTFELFGTLTTENNDTEHGVDSWSVSVSITGGSISAITIKGVIVSTIYIYCEDEDQNPDTPCILRDPYYQDLGAAEMFTRVASLAPPDIQTGCPPPTTEPPLPPGAQGAISAVVFQHGQWLHPWAPRRSSSSPSRPRSLRVRSARP